MPAPKNDRLIQTRVPAAVKRRIDKLVAASGASVATWLRQMAMREVEDVDAIPMGPWFALHRVQTETLSTEHLDLVLRHSDMTVRFGDGNMEIGTSRFGPVGVFWKRGAR